jgi:hypothetical protein
MLLALMTLSGMLLGSYVLTLCGRRLILMLEAWGRLS